MTMRFDTFKKLVKENSKAKIFGNNEWITLTLNSNEVFFKLSNHGNIGATKQMVLDKLEQLEQVHGFKKRKSK
mgnify:CR=1 FL=1